MKNNWQIKKLKEISEVFNGKTPSRVEKRQKGFPVLKIKNIDINDNKPIVFDSFVDEIFFSKYRQKCLKNNDILILNAAHNASYVGSKKYFWQ